MHGDRDGTAAPIGQQTIAPSFSWQLFLDQSREDEVFRFIDFWTQQHGSPPQHLVFDSKLTTFEGLDRLDEDGSSSVRWRLLGKIATARRVSYRSTIIFITLRRR
jgi:hypothetical protein